MDLTDNVENDPSNATMKMITETSTKYTELQRLVAKVHKLKLEIDVADIIHPYHLELKLDQLKDTKKFMELLTINIEQIKLKLQFPSVNNNIEIHHQYHKFVHKFFGDIVPLINEWDKIQETLKWANEFNFNEAEKLLESLCKTTTLRLIKFHEIIKNVEIPDITIEATEIQLNTL